MSFIPRLRTRLVAAALLTVTHSYAQPTPETQHPPPTGSETAASLGTVERLSGKAIVVQRDSSPQLSVGDVVRQGETLRTDGNSRLQIRLQDNSLLTLGPQTEMLLSGVTMLPNHHTLNFFTLLNGYLRAVIAPLQSESEFEVRTPSMVAAVRGTEWVERYNDGKTEILVRRGVVAVSSPPPPGSAPASSGTTPPVPQIRLAPGLGVDYGVDGALTPVARWQSARSARFFDATSIR